MSQTGISNATNYEWKRKCSGVHVSELQRLRLQRLREIETGIYKLPLTNPVNEL